ncbi:MAG: AAA family ATPase [Bacilli bacterium]|nr:AAA family ATPase [Bacilli bacterium]
MKDYTFGEHIYELRKERGLTQGDIANYLGISDKAISKWENGTAKPTISNLTKLAELMDIPLEKIVSYNKKDKISKVTKVVITGGPSSGKTECIYEVKDHFEKLGYKVIVIPSVGTALIQCGIYPWDAVNEDDFERMNLGAKIKLEEIADEAVSNINASKILILCERGTLDVKAYTSNRNFQQMCKEYNTSEEELKNAYDAVFHLKTVAKGYRDQYKQVPVYRKEDPDTAIYLDDKVIEAWSGHSNYRIIDAYPYFEDKMKKLIKEISYVLHEENKTYVEKKYLISMPDVDQLIKNKNCRKVHVKQHYLIDETKQEKEKIVLRRENNKNFYYKVNKKNNVKYSKAINADQYINKLEDENNKFYHIYKDRYYYIFDSRCIKIDVFPFWKDKAILEVDILNDRESIKFPKFINVIEDVTNNESYKNYYLAEEYNENK